ncbi:MAG: metallophosphoesterase [bacterium]
MLSLKRRERQVSMIRRLRKKTLLWRMRIPQGKYAIIADNHGFFDVYEETVKEVLDKHDDLKGIFHLGDMMGTGSTIEDCINCLKFTVEKKIMAIRGNHCRNLLNCDTKHKYSQKTYDFNKELYHSLKVESDLYERFLQFPDKIETGPFDLVHCSFYKPYYSSNGYNNEMCLTYNLVPKPVFASHEHKFQMLIKSGISIKKLDLDLNKDILINKPCIISVPTMNYSKERHKFTHGYLILTILDNYNLLIRAYHLDRIFVKERHRTNLGQSHIYDIEIKDVVWD